MNTSNAIKEKNSRENYAIELRKKHRLSNYQSKWTNLNESSAPNIPIELKAKIDLYMKNVTELSDKILRLIFMIDSLETPIPAKSYCFYLLFKCISNSDHANSFYELGYLDIIIKALDTQDESLLKEICQFLINLTTAKSEYCIEMMKIGLLDILIKIIENYSDDIQFFSIWCIRNLSNSCSDICNYLLSINYQHKIYELLQYKNKMNSHLYILLGEFSKYIIDLNEIERIANIFGEAIINNNNNPDDTFISAFWGIFNLTTHDSFKIDGIFNIKGLIDAIIENSMNNDPKIALPCYKIIGNIASSTTVHTQRLLDHDVLKSIQVCMKSYNKKIRKEVFFSLSNIVAGVAEQIQRVFDFDGLVKESIQGLIDDKMEVRDEAWHVFKNISMANNKDFLLKLVDYGVALVIPQALDREDSPEILKLALDFCERLLLAGDIEKFNTIVPIFSATNCFEAISKKAYHLNSSISDKAESIIVSFYKYYNEVS